MGVGQHHSRSFALSLDIHSANRQVDSNRTIPHEPRINFYQVQAHHVFSRWQLKGLFDLFAFTFHIEPTTNLPHTAARGDLATGPAVKIIRVVEVGDYRCKQR